MWDYETLKIIWWGLIAVLLIGFTLTDGFDLGAAILLPWVARTDDERRVVINAVAPHWDGNQVWLITAGGALFAAWPLVYAAAFSGFYLAMLLVLFALFLRPVGFDYRSKLENPHWRMSWDWALFVGGLVPSIIFGVAFGNLFQGVPLAFDEFLRPSYQGGFWQLLNPLGLLVGLVSVSLITLHGAGWLMLRTPKDSQVWQRSRFMAQGAASLFMLTFILSGLVVSFSTQGYQMAADTNYGATLTPLMTQITADNPGWLSNYARYPWLILAPALGLGGALLAGWLTRYAYGYVFLASSITIVGTLLTAGGALFPFIMPSSLNPHFSLTMWDAVSSEMTLNIMTWVAILFVPLVLSYSAWCYIKMWRRLSPADIQADAHSLY
ncbi:cytochrome d ubiquinol oxidase subunit II [Allopseudospirillum japonicum]|uniref:Cytochrome d ubiquinol oxidase subunit II n=1 Tax=Allopseudospirillum japonicum TaxID=64971 RepID=A0A1H6T7L8_9GAMM|nr:cytochrome d ubiquinol oxidase subunit II [Allopseudospirillum japonicum]SEI76038.1 cytochrome d ubiquinol oxidase subunit II [Allopseudospirillum japonicum]